MRSIEDKVSPASLKELESPEFSRFMEDLNDFAQPLGLHRYVNFSKNWEYPWLWFNGLCRVVQPGTKVLDIGSELSPLPWFFADRGAELTLVEAHSAHLEHWSWIRKKLSLSVEWEVLPSCRLPFCDESFDLVTSFSVIEHQSERKLAVDESIRVLRNEGVLGLSFDLCEEDRGMTYPRESGRALRLCEFEDLIWRHESFSFRDKPIEWNESEIDCFLRWHRTTAEHHNYVVGAAILSKVNSSADLKL